MLVHFVFMRIVNYWKKKFETKIINKRINGFQIFNELPWQFSWTPGNNKKRKQKLIRTKRLSRLYIKNKIEWISQPQTWKYETTIPNHQYIYNWEKIFLSTGSRISSTGFLENHVSLLKNIQLLWVHDFDSLFILFYFFYEQLK